MVCQENCGVSKISYYSNNRKTLAVNKCHACDKVCHVYSAPEHLVPLSFIQSLKNHIKDKFVVALQRGVLWFIDI